MIEHVAEGSRREKNKIIEKYKEAVFSSRVDEILNYDLGKNSKFDLENYRRSISKIRE